VRETVSRAVNGMNHMVHTNGLSAQTGVRMDGLNGLDQELDR
jgi:hypothetical protein